MRHIITVFLLSLPFLLNFHILSLGYVFANQVKGNQGLLIYFPVFIYIYLSFVLFVRVKKPISIAYAIILFIFSYMFLPVRKDIGVFYYIESERNIFWIEREYFTGIVRIFKSKSDVIYPKLEIYCDEEIIHDAMLVIDESKNLTLLYVRSPDVKKYSRKIIEKVK